MLDQILREKSRADTFLISKQGKLLHESERKAGSKAEGMLSPNCIIYGAEIYMELE